MSNLYMWNVPQGNIIQVTARELGLDDDDLDETNAQSRESIYRQIDRVRQGRQAVPRTILTGTTYSGDDYAFAGMNRPENWTGYRDYVDLNMRFLVELMDDDGNRRE